MVRPVGATLRAGALPLPDLSRKIEGPLLAGYVGAIGLCNCVTAFRVSRSAAGLSCKASNVVHTMNSTPQNAVLFMIVF